MKYSTRHVCTKFVSRIYGANTYIGWYYMANKEEEAELECAVLFIILAIYAIILYKNTVYYM